MLDDRAWRGRRPSGPEWCGKDHHLLSHGGPYPARLRRCHARWDGYHRRPAVSAGEGWNRLFATGALGVSRFNRRGEYSGGPRTAGTVETRTSAQDGRAAGGVRARPPSPAADALAFRWGAATG